MPTLRLLVEAGAMVDATDNDGWTPLRYALEQERVLTCCDLVIAGADSDLEDATGA